MLGRMLAGALLASPAATRTDTAEKPPIAALLQNAEFCRYIS